LLDSAPGRTLLQHRDGGAAHVHCQVLKEEIKVLKEQRKQLREASAPADLLVVALVEIRRFDH